MQVYLFRHGQTAGNAAKKYLGATDEPLCPLGIETARAAGSDQTVEEVLVTPLKRTQMTASLLFPNAEQIICPGLREMNFGDFEGRSAEEMRDDPDYRYWVEQTRCMGPCPHGDATVVFQHRVCAAFRREVEKARRAGKDRLYFVVHGGVVMSVLYRFAHPRKPFYSWPLSNCQGYRCTAAEGPEGLVLTDVTLLERVDP
jgi:alpha-ribazole phosphatase